jgi:hypothetical protein
LSGIAFYDLFCEHSTDLMNTTSALLKNSGKGKMADRKTEATFS